MGPSADPLDQATSQWQGHDHLPLELEVPILHSDFDNPVCQEDPANIITINKNLMQIFSIYG